MEIDASTATESQKNTLNDQITEAPGVPADQDKQNTDTTAKKTRNRETDTLKMDETQTEADKDQDPLEKHKDNSCQEEEHTNMMKGERGEKDTTKGTGMKNKTTAYKRRTTPETHRKDPK